MKSKFVTIIVFTLVFSVSAAIVVGSSVINRRTGISSAEVVTTAADITTLKGETVSPETTAVNDNGPGNNIYEQILNQFLGYETVFSAQNVGGHNYNKGKVEYIIDGQTVTTVYETETTVNPDETTAEPLETTNVEENTVLDTTVAVDTTVSDTTDFITETETGADISETTGVETTVEPTDTTASDVDTTEPDFEETTAFPDETTEPVDNSQGEMVAEEKEEM